MTYQFLKMVTSFVIEEEHERSLNTASKQHTIYVP
jgi:hypothetical protein